MSRGDDGTTAAVSRAKSETLAAISALAAKATAVEEALNAQLDGLRTSIDQRAEDAGRSLQAFADQQRSALQEQLRREMLKTRASLHAAVSAAAPGLAGADWGSVTWGNPPVAEHLPAALRIGTDTAVGAPALLPLSAAPGWRVSGGGAREFIAEMVVRAALASPPEGMRLTVFDPGVRGTLGFTSLLREQFPDLFPPASHHEDALVAHLDRLTVELSTVAEKMSVAGVSTFAELPPGERGPHDLVVILDAPDGLTRRGAAALERLIGGCAGRGATVVLETPGRPAGPVPLGADRADEAFSPDGRLISVEVSDTAIRPALGHLQSVRRDQGLTIPQRNTALAAWMEAISSQADRSMTLRALLGDRPMEWSDRGADRLIATLGRSGGEVLRLALSGTDPATPNALIGGATGSGKSNLLLALIYSLAHRYSPRDLQMYLLDFKEGIEFAQLAPQGGGEWLPHVAVLGLESDRSYGIAVLQHLVDEFDRRAAQFKTSRATSLSDYRQRTGRDMPRLLLVADEFQVLFEPDDAQAQRAVELLEKLARKGRAYGIHLVLASQTLSGIQALGTKRESIFAQFHHRISLKNTAAESESILGYGNLAAAGLTGRGRVVVNSELGHPDANTTGTVVWAEPSYLDELRGQLWRKHRQAQAPMPRPDSFTSSAFHPWGEGPEGPGLRADAGAPDPGVDAGTAAGAMPGAVAAVGVPVEVRPSVVGFGLDDGDTGCIGVIGVDDELVDAVMGSLVLSVLGHPRAVAARVSLVETTGRPVGGQGLHERLSEVVHSASSVKVARVEAARAGEFLLSLAAQHPERSTEIGHVVLVDDLAAIDRFGDDGPWDFDAFATELKRFLAVAASRGVLVVVRFRSVAAFTTLGMFGFSAEITRLVLTTGQNDATRIDPTIRVDDAWPRVTLVDTERDIWRRLVPFDLGPSTSGGAR